MPHSRETVQEPLSPRAIIACAVLKPELEHLLRGGENDPHLIYLEQNMHRAPHLLPEMVQEEVDRASQWAEQIVLGYGLCSNGIVGVRAPRQGLVVTRAHDCVALLLGSLQEYKRLSRSQPGTYYLTQGWIQEGKDPLTMMELEYLPKLGRETAEWGAREELRHYTDFLLIHTGAGDKDYLREKARANADFFGKSWREVQGDPGYLERILYGPYDGRNFHLLAPEERIEQRWFLWDTA